MYIYIYIYLYTNHNSANNNAHEPRGVRPEGDGRAGLEGLPQHDHGATNTTYYVYIHISLYI